MAIVAQWNEEQTKEWEEWTSSRPEIVQELCVRFPPHKLYRLKGGGHRVTIYSYSEDGAMTVSVLGKYNLVAFERCVFGISPDDLEECDLPSEGEPLGALLTDEEDIHKFIEETRDIITPKAGEN